MLLMELKKDRVLAKKEGNEKKYQYLTTIVSEIQRLDKTDQEDDTKVKAVITKSVKALKEMIKVSESSEEFQNEIDVLSTYLPKQLSEEELKELIQVFIAEVGAFNMSDMGKVMKRLSEEYKGLYDGSIASSIVKEELSR